VRYKYTVVLVHAMKPKEDGGIAPNMLKVGTKWGRVIIFKCQPSKPWGKSPTAGLGSFGE